MSRSFASKPNASARRLLVSGFGLVAVFTGCSRAHPESASVPALAAESALHELRYRVLLVGDAGRESSGARVTARLAERAFLAPDRTTVLFLGDNIYPAGMPPEGDAERDQAEANLRVQLDPFRGPFSNVGPELLFLPGNHDWDNSGPDGQSALARQQWFLRERGTARSRLAPDDGDPGPECLDRPGVRLALLDTQWWLHRYARRTDVSREQVQQRLGRCIDAAPGHVIVAGHHPLQSGGLHGGYSSFRDHVFPFTRLYSSAWVPLPLLGSLYPWYRSLGTSPQDLANEVNRQLVEALTSVFASSPVTLYAAGHDHNLQVFDDSEVGVVNVVSGAGSEVTPVADQDAMLMGVAQNGFMELDVLDDGQATLRVFVVDADGSRPVYRMALPRPGEALHRPAPVAAGGD